MLKTFLPFSDFRSSSCEVLQYLHRRLGFSLWMITRTEGADWIVLQAEDHGYHIKEGDVFKWTDSFCSRMVEGLGPCIAPQSNDVSAYAAAPIGRKVPIGAYIGVPLTNRDGSLFGTLCAIDPSPQPAGIVGELYQIELLSRMLTTVLANELRADAEMRRAERAEQQAEIDSLTGLLNRRGWDRIVEAEDYRCRRYGHPASVIIVDLDGFKKVNDMFGHSHGDDMLVKASNSLLSVLREGDVLARLGGDEFAILAIDCNQSKADEIATRLEEALLSVELKASLGSAKRDPSKSLKDACLRADEKMYQNKRRNSIKVHELAVENMPGFPMSQSLTAKSFVAAHISSMEVL